MDDCTDGPMIEKTSRVIRQQDKAGKSKNKCMIEKLDTGWREKLCNYSECMH